MSETTKKKKGSPLAIKVILFTLMMLQILGVVAIEVLLAKLDILPLVYMICFGIVVAIITVICILAARRTAPAILMILVLLAELCAMVYGTVAILRVDNTLNKVSIDTVVEVTQMGVLVLEDDTAQSMNDLSGYKIGYVADEEAALSVQNEINGVAANVSYEAVSDVVSLAKALLDSNVEAIIINTAYLDIVSELEGFEAFANVRTLTIAEVEHEVVVPEEPEEEDPVEVDKDTFVVYISGIDTFGSVNVTSRSDVNILAAVNTKTGKVQLINTPRDYYVPLTISNGVCDKLTHAGIYGVEVSKGTLEALYGIKVDYFVRMNFSGFEDIIDAVGGIDVYSDYDFTVTPVKHYVVGMNHLSGIEALAFARERHSFAAGDVQRGKNQMAVITALIQKLASKSVLKNYATILDEISDSFQTDVPTDTMYALVKQQLQRNTSWQIDSYTVTGFDSSAITYSMPGMYAYVMLPNQDEIDVAKQLIENVIGE